MKLLPIVVMVILTMPLTHSTAEASWFPAENISPTDDSFKPSVGIDGSSNAVAVWVDTSQKYNRLATSTKAKGGSWTTPIFIAPEKAHVYSPQVAVNPAGNTIALFKIDGSVQASQLLLGGSWTTPVVVTTDNLSGYPQVAIDTKGNAVAIWTPWSQDSQIVKGAVLRAGVWIPTSTLTSSSNASYPEVAVDASGNAVAVWYEGKSDTIQAATLAFASLTWSSPVAISAPDAGPPSLAVDAKGNAVVVWNQFEGETRKIQAATRPFGGSWSTPVTISPENSGGADVAVDAEGNAVALWWTVSAPSEANQVASLPFGGSWSLPTTITTANTKGLQIAMTSDGIAFAVWRTTYDSQDHIQSARRNDKHEWSAPIDLDVIDYPSTLESPQIAVSDDGDAIAIWTAKANHQYEGFIRGAFYLNPSDPPDSP